MRQDCMIPKCPHEARHTLTIRMRRTDTSAVWAPATNFKICDKHATAGAEIEIIFRPKRNGKITTDVYSPAKDGREYHARRTVDIIQGPNRRQ
jgi:hypothetical protein